MDTALSTLVGDGKITAGPASTHPKPPQSISQIDDTQNQWITMRPGACPDCRRRHRSCEHINSTTRKRIGPGTACDRCKRGKRKCVGVPCSRCRAFGVPCTYENRTQKSDRSISTHANSAHQEASQNTLTQVDANATTKGLPRGARVATNKRARDITENYINFRVKDGTFDGGNKFSHMKLDHDALVFANNTIQDCLDRRQNPTNYQPNIIHQQNWTNYTNSSQNSPVKELAKGCFYGVPAENHAFVDRPDILKNMEVAFAKSSSSGGCRLLALKGLGGMGKTQIMLRYSYLYRTTYEFIFWLKVDSWSTALDSFYKLAINLGFNEEGAMKKESEEYIINWVRFWLETRTNWLLLLDSADYDEMDKKVFKFLPRIGGDIIITTRMHIPSSKATVIHVSKMQKQEAISLLCGSSVDLINQESVLYYAQQIVTELDFMPLAIDHARAYIDNALISFQEYLSMLKDSKKRISLFRYNDEDESNHYKHNIATVWQLSFNQVQAINPLAVQILEACTFLQPENIPVRLFQKQYFISASSTTIREAIAVLVRFSFVVRTCYNGKDSEDDPASELLTIHRLVQKVIYDAMDNNKRLQWAHKIAAALNSEIKFNDSYTIRTRRFMGSYIPHIRHFVILLDDLSEKPLMSKDLSSLLNLQLGYYLDNGIHFGIADLGQLSVRVSEAIYGPEHLETARSLHILGWLYYCQGNYSEAEPLYKRALAIHGKALNSEHLDTTELLNNLAMLYDSQGKFNQSNPLYKRALAINEKVLGPEYPDTAASMRRLARFYHHEYNYDNTEPLYKRVLAIYENVLGSEHPAIATSLNNLAGNFKSQGKYDDAEPLYQRALEIREKALGLEHPATASSLNDLAKLYEIQEKHNEVEALYTRALAVREKALGLEHPNIVTSLNNLAAFYDHQHKYDEAEQLYKRALVTLEKALGIEHVDVVTPLNNLAGLYKRLGKYEEADLFYHRALSISEKVLGPEHASITTLLNNLAGLYVCQGKYGQAELLNQQAFETAVTRNRKVNTYEQ